MSNKGWRWAAGATLWLVFGLGFGITISCWLLVVGSQGASSGDILTAYVTKGSAVATFATLAVAGLLDAASLDGRRVSFQRPVAIVGSGSFALFAALIVTLDNLMPNFLAGSSSWYVNAAYCLLSFVFAFFISGIAKWSASPEKAVDTSLAAEAA